MRKQPSNVVALPRFVAGLNRKYITKTGDQFQPMDVALALALSVRQHGTVDAVRSTARRLSQRVCMEHRPRLTALARQPTNIEQHRRDPREKLNGVLDDDVLWVAQRIIERVTDALGIAPGFPMEILPSAELVDPPKCHYKPMRLAGDPGARHWRCQHCSHAKPLDWSKP
jgi:hypothetical protein